MINLPIAVVDAPVWNTSLPIRTRVFLNGRISHEGSSHFNVIRSFMTSDRDGQDG